MVGPDYEAPGAPVGEEWVGPPEALGSEDDIHCSGFIDQGFRFRFLGRDFLDTFRYSFLRIVFERFPLLYYG